MNFVVETIISPTTDFRTKEEAEEAIRKIHEILYTAVDVTPEFVTSLMDVEEEAVTFLKRWDAEHPEAVETEEQRKERGRRNRIESLERLIERHGRDYRFFRNEKTVGEMLESSLWDDKVEGWQLSSMDDDAGYDAQRAIDEARAIDETSGYAEVVRDWIVERYGRTGNAMYPYWISGRNESDGGRSFFWLDERIDNPRYDFTHAVKSEEVVEYCSEKRLIVL